MFRKHLLSLSAAVILIPVIALAQQKGAIQVETPWARASAGQTGAAYLTLKNGGDAADKLVAVSTPAAARAELHSMTMEGNVMKMRAVENIPVAAHGAAELKPGGLHVMLMGLKAPLKAGETFPLTLTFANAGEVTVQVSVQGAGAVGPMPMPRDDRGPMPHR